MDNPSVPSMSELLRNIEKNPAIPTRDPLLVERESTHGDFAQTAKISQNLKYHMRHLAVSKPNVAQMEVLDMICVKIARILSGDPGVKDHWADIAGYAKLGEEACA